MNPFSFFGPRLFLCFFLFESAEAGIFFTGQTSISNVSANTVLVGDGLVGSAWEGISMEMKANVDANEFRFNPNNGSQIRFKPTRALAQGESITFNFDFNMPLFTGPKITGQTPPARASSSMRISQNLANIDLRTEVTMMGGANSLQNYFGAFAPNAGDSTAANPNVLYFNPDNASGEGVFHTWAIDQARFDSFSLDGNTAVFNEYTQGSTDRYAIVLTDSGLTRNSQDFSYQSWQYEVTNNSVSSIPAGSLFIFSFEGANLEAQQNVPEPTNILFCGIASAVLLFFRKRRFSFVK